MGHWSNIEEFISFFIASQECAPLPLLTLHEESGEERLTNSMDLLFEMMRQQIYSSAAFSDEEREEMRRRKLELLARLRAELAAVDTGCPPEAPPGEWSEAGRQAAYDAMCRYFRELAAVYAWREDVDVRIAPMGAVDRAHPVNTAAAGHFKGLCDLTRGDSPAWADGAPAPFRRLLEMRLPEQARLPYWANVCAHAWKVRLEEAGLA